jgi:dCMP deaminase
MTKNQADASSLFEDVDSPDLKRAKVSSATENESTHQSTVTPCCNNHHLTSSKASSSSVSNDSRRLSRCPSPVRTLSQLEIHALLWKEAAYTSVSSTTSNEARSTSSSAENTTLAVDTAIRKRTNYLSWDDYFFAVAALSAKRSKDPLSPTGACLVDARNRIVGIGYNGFPNACNDNILPWTSVPKPLITPGDTSQTPCRLDPSLFVVHAELNAILNKCSADVAGCRLYCQSFPCHECAKVIVQSRIQRVIYYGDDEVEFADESQRASRIMLTMAGVELIRVKPSQSVITLELDSTGKNAAVEPGTDEAIAIASTTSTSSAAVNEAHRQLLIREANYDPLLHQPSKRPDEDVLSWDDYFTSMAVLTAQRSKDPNTQVGACLVDAQKRIIGLGYNGFPVGCSDDDLPWARQASNALHCKYPYVCHAEVNAILNKGSADVRAATLYVALFPCNECAKMIVQAGIQEVAYVHDYYHDTDACRASRIMFEMAGVRMRKHVPKIKTLRLELTRAGAASNENAGGNE